MTTNSDTDSNAEARALLTLRANGHIEMPEAQTYRQALALMNIIERAAQTLREKALDQSLPTSNAG